MNVTRDRSEYSADQLRVLLARLGVNGSELGRRLGRSRNWVSARATGTAVITDEDALAICRELDVGIRELMPPYRGADRYASILTEIQVEIVDDPMSTDEEVQEFLKALRHMKNFVLSNPDRVNRKPRARKL